MGKEKDLKKPQSKEVAVTMFSEDKVELDDEYNSAADFSRPEKTILKAITEPSDRLQFPSETVELSIGFDAEMYVIPEEHKQEVLEQVYPFKGIPALGDVMYDLHEEKDFKVKDFKVLREDGYNFLVSPYYANSGGTVIDWMPEEAAKKGAFGLVAKEKKRGKGK
jgi:hypothetical protein